MKNKENKGELLYSNNPTLVHLVGELLSEDFSIKNSFENRSLDEIAETISIAKDFGSENPSLLRSKEILTLILHEMELSGLESLPNAPLAVLFPISNPTKNDFYKVYTYLKEIPAFPFSESMRTKLLGQQLSLSLESLAQEALHPFLSEWWPTRESSIALLLNPETEEVRLHPDLTTALNRLAILHQELFGESQFPIQTIENSLRYILSLAKEEDFIPAPIEVGYMLFFFGQQEFLERFLHNSLNVQGVEADELLDFAFRMIRTQKLKAKTFSQVSTFTKQDLGLLEEDHEALKKLLSKLHPGKQDPRNQAA